MILFFSIVLLVWTGMHIHVAWHLSGLHVITSRHARWAIRVVAAVLWLGLPLTLLCRRYELRALGDVVGVVSTNWLGCLFLMFSCLLVVDVFTLGGHWFKAHTRWLRFGASLAGLGLCAVAFVQGHRDPVVVPYEVTLQGLPRERDGLRVLLLSDLHLGEQVGAPWLRRLSTRVEELRPDLIVIAGDLIDHDPTPVLPLVPELARLKAPLGVWAVEGNHDSFGRTQTWEQICVDAGFQVLRNRSALAAPGLRLMGVDDLGVWSRNGRSRALIAQAAMDARKHEGEARILLSHTPLHLEDAAAAGADLMLCGHTHGGQIWPFGYLVALRHPHVVGLHKVGDMSLVISRGAATWGPRMRLWLPGEMPLITLRAP